MPSLRGAPSDLNLQSKKILVLGPMLRESLHENVLETATVQTQEFAAVVIGSAVRFLLHNFALTSAG